MKILKRIKCAFKGHKWALSRTHMDDKKCVRCGKRAPRSYGGIRR